MAIAVNSQESAGAGHRATASPLTWTFTNTAGTKILLGICASALAAVTLSTPTYNGTSLTLVGSQLSFDGGFAKVAIYYLDTPATGANTVSIPFSSSSGTIRCNAGAISFTGCAAGVGTSTSAASGAGVTSVSSGAITTASGNYIFATGGWGSGAGGVAGAGFTRTFLVNGSGGTGGDDGIGEYQQSAGSAITPAFSWTNNDIGAIFAVELTVAGGATAKLRRNSSLNGLGASGPFFHDPLSVSGRRYSFPETFALKGELYVPAHVARGELLERAA